MSNSHKTVMFSFALHSSVLIESVQKYCQVCFAACSFIHPLTQNILISISCGSALDALMELTF